MGKESLYAVRFSVIASPTGLTDPVLIFGNPTSETPDPVRISELFAFFFARVTRMVSVFGHVASV